jgi:hypothetical protein
MALWAAIDVVVNSIRMNVQSRHKAGPAGRAKRRGREAPAERLDAAADRLTAVIFAISNVNIALNDFTSELSDEQKARLNSLVR